MKKADLGKHQPGATHLLPRFFEELICGQQQAANIQTEKPLYTGRYIVAFDDPHSIAEHRYFFHNKVGLRVANSSDFVTSLPDDDQLSDVDVLIYDEFGVALVSGESDEQLRIMKQNATTRMIIQPERVVYIPNYVSVGHNSRVAWGIGATRTDLTQYTGMDIKVAVLDSGLDMTHPDYAGRNIVARNFADPADPLNVNDTLGHGTHCIGIACGDTDDSGLRYGIARDASIYVGKVLDESGRGPQKALLDGIMWAAREGCKVISISLVSQVDAGVGYDISYERAAKYAMSTGCIVVAAAGNESKRSQQVFSPVGSPANCPSIIAVAAVDKNMNLADFSNRGINAGITGGAVDIAAPGINIYSSWPGGVRYKSISGTSMATPHVAGILALLWQQNPGATPDQIIDLLYARAQKLTYNAMDVGAGLSIAT
jgi:subtilisin family serine protease